MPYAIRPGRPDDAETLRGIERAAARAFAGVGYPALAAGEPTDSDDLRDAAADGLLFVAVDAAGHPAGFVLAAPLDGALYVQEIDVHPDHAGHGLAVPLLDAAAVAARQHGLAALTLTTFRQVPWNAPYYARLGFRAMTEDEIGPGLRILIARQGAAGLDIANRVAMRRAVI